MRTAIALVAVCLGAAPGAAFAQRKPEIEKISGKVQQIKEEGRKKILVIDATSGETLEFPLTPKTRIEAFGTGNVEMIKTGEFITAQGTLSNDKVFVSELTIHQPPFKQLLPTPGIGKAPAKAGDSENSYLVAGTVQDRRPAPDSSEYELLALRLPNTLPPVLLEKDVTVRTITPVDNKVLLPGTAVELGVIRLRGDRMNLVSVTTGAEAADDK